jgi:hypothetical protein
MAEDQLSVAILARWMPVAMVSNAPNEAAFLSFEKAASPEAHIFVGKRQGRSTKMSGSLAAR